MATHSEQLWKELNMVEESIAQKQEQVRVLLARSKKIRQELAAEDQRVAQGNPTPAREIGLWDR